MQSWASNSTEGGKTLCADYIHKKYNIPYKEAIELVERSPLEKCVEMFPEVTLHEPIEQWEDEIVENLYQKQ